VTKKEVRQQNGFSSLLESFWRYSRSQDLFILISVCLSVLCILHSDSHIICTHVSVRPGSLFFSVGSCVHTSVPREQDREKESGRLCLVSLFCFIWWGDKTSSLAPRSHQAHTTLAPRSPKLTPACTLLLLLPPPSHLSSPSPFASTFLLHHHHDL